VARQYTGTAGRIENAQVGVFLAYAAGDGARALIDRELYLPEKWTADRGRCRAAGIGDEVAFATKPKLAQAMLERAVQAGCRLAGSPPMRHPMRLSCQAALGSFSWVAGKAVASSYSQPVVRQCQRQPSRRPDRLRWAPACRSPSARRRS
jgi:hypothetical protein